ncbi:unnamed protein product [Sphagnum troendelagicum]
MDGNIPSHLGSEEGNVDKVKVVVDHVESYLKEQNKHGNTPLHLAAEEGHVEVVQLLLERCSTLDLEVKNADGNTLLHQATMNGHDKVVQVLLDHAATEFDLDDKNNDGNTPLHLAVKEGHVQVVNVLLGCGLELQLDAKNEIWNTPLHLASEGGYLEVVKVLLEHADGEKCGLDSFNAYGNYPLNLAIEGGHVDVVVELLERAGTKLKLNDGYNTPLHLAAEGGQDEIVAMLLALDAPKQSADSDSTERNNDQKRTTKLNLNATNKEENTPLHLACKEGHDEVVDVMLKRVEELALDAINIRGNTPLHLAAINGHVHVVNKGAIQTYQPATWHEQTMSYYFEIKIKDRLNTFVSIGFTNEIFKYDIATGWDSYTYAYRSYGAFLCDWSLVKAEETVNQDLGVDFDFRYTTGDTVGAGVNYVTGKIFFTKNQKLVKLIPCNLKTTLYPTVGFEGQEHRKSTVNVEVNFKAPYIFDLSDYMRHSNLKTPRKWSLQPKLAFLAFFQQA